MAGWYDSNYKFRAPVSIVDTVGSPSPGDVTFTIPPTWDHFWANIQSTGYDIRVCDADGVTLLVYDRAAGFSYATKTLTIEIDGLNPCTVANSVQCIWIYYGYSAAADAITVFAPASPIFGYLSLERPPSNRVLICGDESPGSTKPRNTVTKASSVSDFIYWDVSDILLQRATETGGSMRYEGVWTVSYPNVYLAGVSQAAMFDATVTRFIEYLGKIYIKMKIAAGTSAIDYTAEVKFNTRQAGMTASFPDYRVLTYRALLMVRDVSEV